MAQSEEPSPRPLPVRDPQGIAEQGADPHDVRRGELGEGVRLAFVEFLAGALVTAGGVLLLGLLVYVLDRTDPAFLSPVHGLLRGFFRSSGTVSGLLEAIASTVITVASITFSLLLVAVQQSASSLTAQAFDQFLRRRVNQFYMGFFVGLGAYALLQAASVHSNFVPVYGTALAVLLSVAAVGLLLVLVYNTINQMRPVVIVEAIHDHLVEARARQLRSIVWRTRTDSELGSAPGRGVLSGRTGFVLHVDLDRIQEAIDEVDGPCEVVLDVVIGQFVAYGDRVAVVRTADEGDGERVAVAVDRGVRRARQRNIDSVDAAYGLEQLETLGWTSISGAKHNPQAARVVIAQLRDVMARFTVLPSTTPPRPDTAIVYRDNVPDVLMRTLESLAVVTADSQQHQVAADILDAMAGLFPGLPERYRGATREVLVRTLPALSSHPPTLALEAAMERMQQALSDAGEDDTARIVRDGLKNLRGRIGEVDVEYTPR